LAGFFDLKTVIKLPWKSAWRIFWDTISGFLSFLIIWDRCSSHKEFISRKSWYLRSLSVIFLQIRLRVFEVILFLGSVVGPLWADGSRIFSLELVAQFPNLSLRRFCPPAALAIVCFLLPKIFLNVNFLLTTLLVMRLSSWTVSLINAIPSCLTLQGWFGSSALYKFPSVNLTALLSACPRSSFQRSASFNSRLPKQASSSICFEVPSGVFF
jgi:hypothetical protein